MAEHASFATLNQQDGESLVVETEFVVVVATALEFVVVYVVAFPNFSS